MKKKSSVFVVVLVILGVALGLIIATPTLADSPRPDKNVDVVIYVTSQGLYYDSIIGPDLPPHGPFQLLEANPALPTNPPLQTEFGPGDPGYVGGRWKMADGNGGYVYFSCPLLGPGRAEP